jgi:hypothetical protein
MTRLAQVSRLGLIAAKERRERKEGCVKSGGCTLKFNLKTAFHAETRKSGGAGKYKFL